MDSEQPKKRRAPLELNGRQRIFVEEYPRDFNKIQAAIRAGYSPKSAARQSANLTSNPRIKAALDEKMKERLLRVGVEPERVLREVAKIAHHDLRKIFDENHVLKPVGEWDDETSAAIAGVEVFEEFQGRGEERVYIGRTKKIKLFDRTKALELLGRHLKLFTEKHEVSGPGGGPLHFVAEFGENGEGENPDHGGNGKTDDASAIDPILSSAKSEIPS